MKKSILTLGAIAALGSSLLLFNNNREEVLLDNEYLASNKSIAIYVKQEDGNYEKTNTIPTSGYTLNSERSVCSNNAKPSWNINNNSLKLSNLSSNTSCYLYFDTYCKSGDTACQTILANKEVKTRDKITGPLTENTTGSIYAAEDDYGISYYFAGAVDNNWVRFAGFYWRIIRVNGDGSIRMIYNGPTTDQTGESTQIGTTYFNAHGGVSRGDYMYGDVSGSSYEEIHKNINNSLIKTEIDTWYENNLKGKYDNYLSTNMGFCGDRGVYNESQSFTTYKGLERLPMRGEQNPIFNCTNINNDFYTTSFASKGNKSLIYPIGLITADEVVYAGGASGFANDSFYLYTNQYYFTMTPSISDYLGMFYMRSGGGFIAYDSSDWDGVYASSQGIRPVINLKADVTLTGSGTKDNPYVAEGA